MIEVLTPATSTRLTTVEAVRARYGITPEEMTDDALTKLIDQASQMAVDYCQRPFGRERVRQIVDTARPVRAIVLERTPAEIESVTYGDLILDPADYHHVADSGLLMLHPSGSPAWYGRVEIVYWGGWRLPGEEGADLPSTVEAAAMLLVGALWSMSNRDPGLRSENVQGIGSVTYWVPGAGNLLPDPNAELFLQPYRRF